MLSIQTPNNAPNSPLFCKLFRWSQNKNSNILISIKVQFVLNRQQQNARFHISACPLFHGQLKVPLLTSKTIKAWGFSKVHVWRLSGTVLTKNNKPFSHRSFAGTASDGTVAHSIYAHSSFTNSFFFFFLGKGTTFVWLQGGQAVKNLKTNTYASLVQLLFFLNSTSNKLKLCWSKVVLCVLVFSTENIWRWTDARFARCTKLLKNLKVNV